jgi:hypothetical protein
LTIAPNTLILTTPNIDNCPKYPHFDYPKHPKLEVFYWFIKKITLKTCTVFFFYVFTVPSKYNSALRKTQNQVIQINRKNTGLFSLPEKQSFIVSKRERALQSMT